MQSGKKNKRHVNWKRIKLFLPENCVIFYTEDAKESTEIFHSNNNVYDFKFVHDKKTKLILYKFCTVASDTSTMRTLYMI